MVSRSNSVTSEAPSSLSTERIIIVAHMLPLLAQRKADDTGWTFSWDEDSLVLQLKDGLPEDMELLWPLFHYMLPLAPDHGGRFDRSLWQAPFPSSEIYRTLPVRDEILRALLNADLLNTRLKRHDTEWRIGELRAEYAGKTLLKQHPQRRGKNEASTIARRINREFGWEGYQPVGCVAAEPANGASAETARQSMLVVSEFIGCSPSLSGAIRVNPWNIETMADALNTAITMPTAEKHMRHEKHFKYVSTHDVAYWAQSFMGDLERTCRDHQRRRSYGIGFGLSFKVVALDPNFRKLLTEHIVSAYGRSQKRAILLDYDGTMITQTSHNKTPNQDVITLLNTLCNDPKNSVFIVSGRGRKTLSDWFSPCERLGIAAEHGYYYRRGAYVFGRGMFLGLGDVWEDSHGSAGFRWRKDEEWTTCVSVQDFEWKEVAAPVMNLYTESTDGSIIEEKESAIVWHYRDADPDFGSWQAKELLDHLESVLANEPVAVKSGQHIVEVKPQGVSKGVIVEKLLSMMAERGSPPDFVLCVGDDRSDEDMFESIATTMSLPPQSSMAEVFACTVGQKPSKAKYYLDDTSNVLNMLQGNLKKLFFVAFGGML
ncbi:hypothetical protein AXG93_2145s1830 [Marchantia polymorpha subsp. ruderalis]|uniref:Uncharacterized protein n=1 Tax=Marchantia polymorpha subsp. ruderalis TaxID=1480154 RepID=A0A176VZR0_MARPO|nr:hypothetical protein AXG93_2145s1830 [Marchantia polymorpha subsp. ruderalis]